MGGAISAVAKATKKCFKAVGKVVVKAAKGVRNFIQKHSKKLLAGVAVVAGVALCFVPGFQIVGAGLICGGINAGMLSFNKNATWKDFGKAFLGGFAAGFITTLAAPAIAAMAAAAGGLATSTFAAAALSCTVSAAAYAGVGVLTNGINNIIFEKDFLDNFGSAAICGGLIGFISPIINSAGINEAVVKIFKPLETKFNISLTTGAMASIGGRGLRMGANFCISAITQKIQTGRISLQRAVIDSVVYGYVNHKMAANAITAGESQFCTIDQPVPYTFIPEKVKTVVTPPPPALSQTQTNSSHSSNNVEFINSNGTTPTKISPVIVGPTRNASRNAEDINASAPSISNRDAVNQQRLNENNLEIRSDNETLIAAPSEDVISPPTRTSLMIPNNTFLASTPPSECTTNNKIIQSLNKLKPINSYIDKPANASTASKINELESKMDGVSTKVSQYVSAAGTKADATVGTKSESLINEKNATKLIEYGLQKQKLNLLPKKENSKSDERNTIQKTNTTVESQTFKPDSNTVAASQSSYSPFISNIVEEFQFIESERNRSEEENVFDAPSKVYVFQNATDNEKVRVGVQVSSKVSNPYASTNPRIETINIESNKNEMGYGQKLSTEKVLPQQSSFTISQAAIPNQNLQSINNCAEIAPPKVVVTYPIVSFIENEYKIMHWEKWPQLSKNVKIVTVSGPQASGRTSFIHSLAYFWGYKLLKEQVVTSKLRIGVIMYHFPEKNLVIFDCCDSMDASNPDEITASSLILETFCHLVSDHRIHHLTIDEAVSDEINSLATVDANTLTETQKENAINLCENSYFNHDILLLNFLSEGYSMNTLDTNHKQLNCIAKLVEEKTKPMNIAKDSEDEDIRKLLCQAWYSVVTNEELKTDFSKVVNQVATAVEGNDYDIQGFINKLIKFAESCENKIFVNKFGKFVEEIGKNLEAKKDKADPLIAFKLVTGCSAIFFEEGLKTDDLKKQNDMIELALEGFTFFLRNIKDSQTFELISLRMAINDHKILKQFLNVTIVYQNFERCWTFLQYAAIYGYRLELIEYNIFEKILQVVNKQQYSIEGERIASWALLTLEALLTLDTSKVFGDDPPPSEADKFRLSQQQFVKTFGIFSKLVEKKMEPLRTTRNMTIEEVQKRYVEILQYPKEFFNATDIAKKNEKSFEDLDPRQSHFFTVELFRQIYKSLAFYFADHVIENHQIFMSQKTDPQIIVTSKIKVWQRVLNLCEESESLYKNVLAKTDIKKWVIEMLKSPNSPYFIEALKLSNNILNGDYHADIRKKLAEENSIKEINKNKINTLDDVKRQGRRKELLLHYGNFCLDLIESGHVQRIIDIFIDRHFDIPFKATVFVSHIERLLHYGFEEEDRKLCFDIFIKKRHKIIAKLSELFQRLLKAKEIEIKKSKPLMAASALMISELVYYFYANDKQNFYQSFNESGKVLYECKSWINLMPVIAVTVRDILQRRRNSKRDSDDDDDNTFHPRIVLSFIYNTAMTSEITNSEIIAKTGVENRIVELKDTDAGNWDLMILSEKKFIKIKRDEVNIRRCAYIYAKYVLPELMDSKKNIDLNLKESFASELEFFKGIFKKHVDEVSAEIKEKELVEGWITAEEARQKHLGRLEDKITGPKELNIGTVVNANGPSTSLQYSNEFAVEDLLVYYSGHLFLENIKVRYTNHKIEIFLSLIQKLAKNEGTGHHELKIQNINVQKILGLQYARDALEMFGYSEVTVDKEAFLIANPKIIEQEYLQAEECLNFVNSINEDLEFKWHCDHSFKAIENGIPLQECRLPATFFDKNKEQNSSITLPIRILKEKRRYYSFSGVSLVRVKLQDGRFFQAVFHKSATLSDIGAELDILFLNDLKIDPLYCICDENGKEIENMSQK
uniref:Uncharacterized protein n=1 Tax=Panagrolaimus sp. ES5 TaxID=591445 RepID=A0AC34GT58_9BILA